MLKATPTLDILDSLGNHVQQFFRYNYPQELLWRFITRGGTNRPCRLQCCIDIILGGPVTTANDPHSTTSS